MLDKQIENHPAFLAIHRAREKAGKNAQEAQAKYRRTARNFLFSTTGAAVFGGLLLYGLDSQTASDAASGAANIPAVKSFVIRDDVQKVLTVLQALCLGAAAYFGYQQTNMRFDQTWIKNRMRAEAGRLSRARTALEIGHSLGPDAFKSAGTYFYAQLVVGQMEYLSKATENKGKNGRSLVALGAIFAGLAALLSGLGGIQIAGITLIGALVGVVSPALISALKTWEGAMSDQERAILHNATWENLNAKSGEKHEFEKRIDANDLDGALAWADEVIEILKKDHKGFETLVGNNAIEGQVE